VKYGSEQVLDFNYFENSDVGIILLNDLISGTSLTTQEVLDYYLPILRMLKTALEIIADSITEK
jgi:hypothetical protein